MINTFPGTPANATTRMHECGYGNFWFYHRRSYPNNEPLYLQHLISGVSSTIDIWDPYVNIAPNDNDLLIFSNIPNDITLKILTMKGLKKPVNYNYLNDLVNGLKQVIPPGKNVRFALRVIDESDPIANEDWFFHDRLLILDKTRVFVVGGSVGYHRKPVKSTGIYKVENPDTCDFILTIFDEYWKYSIQNEIPLTFLHP
ncbi:MAG TPA: hypothetical protein VGQ59_21820 [Cyclobacteriaceae bacterium]|jgi:hypothetical protein|nr:hypothetical protein [Cyclobacteriaceae bacterium]